MTDLFGGSLPETKNYTVLARKYRPKTLDELIGQEALVRTLRNAMESGRLAHAFLLTGIRGVGKTTTARIIARTLNSISSEQDVDQNIDVIEMDAASNTGVENIREIIEAAKYKPLSSPFKIYIIDEVHMLSKGAFNALLKTLEEPPEHVKFIFATTEIRKIPVTILSRCQRFDLKRVDAEVLISHLKRISELEAVTIEEGALRLIANAAEGSVRDSLSILDQAIAYSNANVTTLLVQEMLGYADKSATMALFEQLSAGNVAEALDNFANICQTSAEPIQILQDVMDFCHLVTRIKTTPNLNPAQVTESELSKARELANKLSIPALSRIWQMLLKGHNEVRFSPNPKQTAEMALIRIAYSAELPDPSDLIRDLKKKRVDSSELTHPTSETKTNNDVFAPASFLEVAELFKKKRELIIYNNLYADVHLVSFKPEQIEIRPTKDAPKELATKLVSCLNQWTGKRWVISISNAEGEPTLLQQEQARKMALLQEAGENPIIKEILEVFPGSVIKDVKLLSGDENGHSANHETSAANAKSHAGYAGEASS